MVICSIFLRAFLRARIWLGRRGKTVRCIYTFLGHFVDRQAAGQPPMGQVSANISFHTAGSAPKDCLAVLSSLALFV